MFIKNAKSENLNHETIRKYDLVFRQLIAFANDEGIRFAHELDLPALQKFRGTWKDGSLSRSKKQERLRSIFKFAVAQKWAGENHALSLGKIKVERTQQTPFTEAEIEKILKAAQGISREVYTFVLVMRFSGLRISDACTLRVSSLEGSHLVLRTLKTGSKVRILLPDVVADALRKIRKVSPSYFFWSGNGKLASITELWRSRRLKRVFAAAEVEGAHPHRFRHTFATRLLQQGVPVGMVASLLGNSERIVEKHYSAWIEARQKGLDEAVQKANGYHQLAAVQLPFAPFVWAQRGSSACSFTPTSSRVRQCWAIGCSISAVGA
jgi:integrase